MKYETRIWKSVEQQKLLIIKEEWNVLSVGSDDEEVLEGLQSELKNDKEIGGSKWILWSLSVMTRGWKMKRLVELIMGHKWWWKGQLCLWKMVVSEW